MSISMRTYSLMRDTAALDTVESVGKLRDALERKQQVQSKKKRRVKGKVRKRTGELTIFLYVS